MGLFDTIVSGVKSAASAISGAAASVTDYFKGAQETIANYIAVHGINDSLGPEFTQEMRQKALKSGPVDSLAYRMSLANQWLVKNPSEVVMIGSVGKAGKITSKTKGAAKILDFAKKGGKATATKAAGEIKNVAGFTTAIAKKVAGSKGFASIFKGTFGKILGVGGLVTGLGLLATNTLDFYNWNGPIQTLLKQKFPWLFPAVNNAKAGKKTNEIRRMTPDETRQLQQIFFDQTGTMYSGEELRKLIFEEFGITVLEEKARASDIPGPLSAGATTTSPQSTQSQSAVSGSAIGSVIKASAGISASAPKAAVATVLPSQFPRGYVDVAGRPQYTVQSAPNYLISTQGDLEVAALNEVAAFLNALPNRMTFDFIFKKSFKDNEGVTRKGNFAFMRVKVFTKTGGTSTLAELPLGTIPAELYNPGQLNAGAVSVNVSSFLSGAVEPANLAAAAETPEVMPDTAPDIFKPTIQRKRVLIKPGNLIAYLDKEGWYWNQDVDGVRMYDQNFIAAARKRGEVTEIVDYNPDYFAELSATKSTI